MFRLLQRRRAPGLDGRPPSASSLGGSAGPIGPIGPIVGGGRRTWRLLALGALLVSLGGCSLTPPPTPPTAPSTPRLSAAPTATPTVAPSPTPCRERLRVALVTDLGGLDDGGFNAAAREGLLRAAAGGCIEPIVIETKKPTDYAKNIAAAVEADAAVVIGIGLFMADALGDAAAAHPDRRFIAVDAVPSSGHDASWSKNGESLVFAEDELGYLAGILAASLTETGVVGAVGAVDIPPIEAFLEGFWKGAKALRPNLQVHLAYGPALGDPAAGRKAAEAILAKGADVIFAASGLEGVGGRTSKELTGDGALLAACAAGGLAIGAEIDQWLTLPAARPCLVTSVVKDVAAAVAGAIDRIAAGAFAPGLRIERAATGGIGWAPFRDLADRVPTAARERLEATFRGLAEGRVSTGVVVDGVTPGD